MSVDRALRPRALAGVLICALVVALVLLLARSAAADQPTTAVYTGTYSGTISYTDLHAPNGANPGEEISESLSWAIRVRDEYRGGELIGGSASESAQGTSYLQVHDGKYHGCHARATYSGAVSPQKAAGRVGPGVVDGHPAVNAGFSVPALTYDTPSSGFCPDLTAPSDYGPSTCAALNLTPKELNDLIDALGGAGFQTRSGSSKSYDIAHTDSTPCYGSTETQTLTLSATVSANGAAAPPHHPTPTNNDAQRRREKLEAQKDLLGALRFLPVPCGVASVGATSLVWGATVPGVGSAALIPAALIGASQGRLCGSLVLRILDDSQVANDPPRQDVDVLARVAQVRVARGTTARACRAYHGSELSFCDEVAAKLAVYVAAVAHATAVDSALVPTIDRQTGALRARNRAALVRQDAEGRKLESELDRALSAESRDGRALADLISAHHVQAKLTAAQDGDAVAASEAQLSRHRESTQAKLSALLGATKLNAAEAPRAVDLLSLLR